MQTHKASPTPVKNLVAHAHALGLSAGSLCTAPSVVQAIICVCAGIYLMFTLCDKSEI